MFWTILAAVGLSHILVDSSLPPLVKLRGWLLKKQKEPHPAYVDWAVELVSCYQCTGWWSGLFMGLVVQPMFWGFEWWGWNWLLGATVTPLVAAFAASFASMVGAALLNYLDAPAKSLFIKNDKT